MIDLDTVRKLYRPRTTVTISARMWTELSLTDRAEAVALLGRDFIREVKQQLGLDVHPLDVALTEAEDAALDVLWYDFCWRPNHTNVELLGGERDGLVLTLNPDAAADMLHAPLYTQELLDRPRSYQSLGPDDLIQQVTTLKTEWRAVGYKLQERLWVFAPYCTTSS